MKVNRTAEVDPGWILLRNKHFMQSIWRLLLPHFADLFRHLSRFFM